MRKIEFYQTENGKEPVKEYLDGLACIIHEPVRRDSFSFWATDEHGFTRIIIMSLFLVTKSVFIRAHPWLSRFFVN